MIKHIFCDLDGTLYENGIKKDDILAIERIEKQGVVFNVATGRVFKQANNIIKNNLDMNGYYICENGSFVYDKDGNMIFKETISDNLAKKIIARFESDDAKIYFKHDGKIILLDDKNNPFVRFTKDFLVDPNFIKRESFDNLIGNIGIACESEEELIRIELYLKSEFNEVVDIYFSSSTTLNIVPKGASKINAIKFVCDRLGANLEEIATMGDSPNDICMLDGVKHSFAMSTAREDVRGSANYLVDNVSSAIDIIEKINRK